MREAVSVRPAELVARDEKAEVAAKKNFYRGLSRQTLYCVLGVGVAQQNS